LFGILTNSFVYFKRTAQFCRTYEGAVMIRARTNQRWTPEEDQQLLRMIEEKARQPQMCAALKRSAASIKARVKKLRANRIKR
jgi:hypothetical protein